MRSFLPLIGLTGGIASGKSWVARLMVQRGWTLIDADLAAREVVKPGSEGLDAVVATFGSDVLCADGTLNRPLLGAIVFQDDGKRKQLEALLHPRIESLIQAQLDALPNGTKGAVVDAALWVERGRAHHFDAFWVVDAPEELRIQRLSARDHIPEVEARKRFATQSSTAEKILHADLVIPNDGRDLTELLQNGESALLADWKLRRAHRWRDSVEAPFQSEALRKVLTALLSKGGECAEVFVERRRVCNLGLEDGRMEDVLSSETFGAGLRLEVGETTRFADLISPSFNELLEAAHTLASTGQGSSVEVPPLVNRNHPSPSHVDVDPGDVPITQNVALVKELDRMAREIGEARHPGGLRQVAAFYGDSTQDVFIAAAECSPEGITATLTQDRRVQGVLRISVVAGVGADLQRGYAVLGESRGFEQFQGDQARKLAEEAVRQAFQLAFEARPTPAGTFPVILSSSAGGTMIHEACGHGLEADLALAGMSSFAGKLGQKVAAESVTIIDDGTLPSKRGSSACDDEGNATQRVVLIEKGVLKRYLQSRKTARRMGQELTGNGRRESYRNLPIPRMRNTFLAPGSDSPEAILRDLDRGLLVKHMGGGQVDTVTGNFVFEVSEGYWVEKGAVQFPVKRATLSGCGPEVLKQLQRIAGDLEHFDIGTCGKDGQGVPVSDALPTILCPALVVGGTAEALPSVI
jgi:TldD protein